MQYVAFGCRALLGVVFLVAVFSKLSGRRAFAEFKQSVDSMRLLPSSLSTVAAVLTVIGEALATVLLAVPHPTAGLAGFSLAAVILAVFAVAITFSVRRGNNQPCRCFGRSSTPLGRLHVWRNVFLVFVALLGSIATTLPSGPAEVAPAITAAFAGLIGAAIVISLDDLVYLFGPPKTAARS
jgi:uncharacterized membrane protein YphA (DoxX/SURF4 family)